MNLLVEHLWAQAADITQRLPNNRSTGWETEVAFLDIFSKLVVLECADIAAEFNNHLHSLSDKEFRAHSHRVGNCIKDRFGMEYEQTI